MMNEIKQKAMLQGQDYEKVMEESGKYGEEIQKEAERRIKTALIIAKIAKNEDIKVLGEDIDAKIIEISRLYNTTAEAIVNEMKKNPDMIHYLTQQIMSQKVTKFLIDNAKIVEK